jgi:hypothetical protein
MYYLGIEVSKNYKKAGRYFNKAAKRGYAPAQYRLGLIFKNGLGVNQNYVTACAWLAVSDDFYTRVKPKKIDELTEKELIMMELKTVFERIEDKFSTIHSVLINKELDKMRNEMSPEQINEASLKEEKFIQYRKRRVQLGGRGGVPSVKEQQTYLPDIVY